MTLFKGLSAFPITPADGSGRVDTDALGKLAARLVEAEVDSIGLLGSTGGYMYLDRDQRRRAVAAAAEVISGRVPLVVGIGALRTDAVLDLARDAEANGASGLLLAPVSYTPLTQDEAFEHYATVAKATGLPICIYNNPGTTHFTFGDELLKRLGEVRNIAAVKMPLPKDLDFAGELSRLRPRLPTDFSVGYSGDWECGEALLQGADAWYSVVAGTLPEPSLRLTRAAQAGSRTEAMRMNATFEPLWSLFREFGSFRVVHAIVNLLGLSDRQPPRPILPVPAKDLRRVEAALAALAD